jgi:nitrogen fixation NifU-like protein
MANSLLNDPEILRELIMDHYQYPHNHKLVDDDSYASVHMASDSCIDDITVQSKIRNGVIEDIRFDGVACTISTASTSMMTELLRGKTTAEAKEIMQNYFNMIDAKEYDGDILEEAIAFKNVYRQANRIKCATIGWRAMQELIEESEKGNE